MAALKPLFRSMRRDESLGLALALVGHAALLSWLVWQRAPAPLPPPERMTVTISDVVGPVSTAPQPQPEAAAPDRSPVPGEAPPPPPPEAAPLAKPAPFQPPPRAVVAQPAKPIAKSAPATPARQPAKPSASPGASAFDSAFAKGVPGALANGKAKTPPAAQVSAQQRSSWSSLIGSRVRGPWNSCAVKGLEVEQLRATVRFTLASDGSVLSIDEPQMAGTTPANQAQVRPFRDCAVRAIKLAAPFTGLPPEFYDDWKSRKLTFKKE